MTKIFKINKDTQHPRNSSMLVEKYDDNSYVVHTYRRGVPASFSVDAQVLQDVKALLSTNESSLELLIHVLSDFKVEQKQVVSLLDEALTK